MEIIQFHKDTKDEMNIVLLTITTGELDVLETALTMFSQSYHSPICIHLRRKFSDLLRKLRYGK